MGEEAVGGVLLGLTAVALGPLVHALTTAAAEGRIARNQLVGIRTRRTLSSDAAWTRGHAAAAPWTRRTAWATALVGLVTVALALSDRPAAAFVAGMGAMAVLVLGLLVATSVAGRGVDGGALGP